MDSKAIEAAARAWCDEITDTKFDDLGPLGRARCLEDFTLVIAAYEAARQPVGLTAQKVGDYRVTVDEDAITVSHGRQIVFAYSVGDPEPITARQPVGEPVRYVRWHPKHGYRWEDTFSEFHGDYARTGWTSIALYTAPPVPPAPAAVPVGVEPVLGSVAATACSWTDEDADKLIMLRDSLSRIIAGKTTKDAANFLKEPGERAMTIRDAREAAQAHLPFVQSLVHRATGHAAPPAPAAVPVDGSRDSQRLDFLDRMNATLNARHGTNYGWRLILSPQIVRLMAGTHAGGYVGDIDLNDSHGGNAKLSSCRAAIDSAMLATHPQPAAAKDGA